MVIGPVNHSCSMKVADQSQCSNRVSGHLCSCSFCGSRKGTAGRWWFTEPPINKLDCDVSVPIQMFHGLSNDFLYSAYKVEVVFRDEIGNQKCGHGTGFFVVNDSGILHFITNRHIVDITYRPADDKDYSKFHLVSLSISGKAKDPQTGLPSLTFASQIIESDLRFSEKVENDIACLANFKIEAERSACSRVDFFIPIGFLATEASFANDLSICDFLAFPGYPEWHDRASKRPILRMGTLSSDPRYSYQYKDQVKGDCLAYEAYSFGGSSGSPVFALQKGLRPGAGIEFDGFRDVLLVGINAGHLTTPGNGAHSGISYLYKSTAIRELLGQESNIKIQKTGAEEVDVAEASTRF